MRSRSRSSTTSEGGRDMPDLYDLLSDHIDREVRDLADARVTAGPGLRPAVRRRRRAFAVRTGSATGIAVVALALGAVAWPLGDDANEDDPATGYAPPTLTTATIALDEPSWYQHPMYSLACGDPVPETSDDTGGFSAELNPVGDIHIAETDGNFQLSEPVGGRLSYEGPELPAAAIDPAMTVIAKDGRVVATVVPGEVDPIWPARSEGLVGSFHAYRNLWWGAMCEGEEPGVGIGHGEYELYLVQRIHTSETDLALRELRDGGLSTAWTENAYLRPGSIDCQEQGWNDWQRPIGCFPSALPGGDVDFDAGTVSVPYRAADYAGDLDVLLVSGPIPVVVDDDVSWGDPQWALDLPTLDSVDELRCGLEYQWLNSDLFSQNAWVDATVPTEVFSTLAEGATVPGSFDVPYAGSTARIEWGPLDQVWIVRPTTGDNEGNVPGRRIIGRGTLELSTGAAIEIDRGDQRAVADLTMTDVQWCEGEGPTATILSYLVVGPTRVSGDFGEDTVQLFGISRDQPR